MTAVESMSIGMGMDIPVPPPVTDLFSCAVEEALDNQVNWRSPFRPTYQCVRGEDGEGACVRRATYGGVPGGGFGMSAVTSVLAPRSVEIYPSCGTCLSRCST